MADPPKPFAAVPAGNIDDRVDEAAAKPDGRANGEMRFQLVSAADLLGHIAPPEYLVDELFESGTACGLIGAPESGKSLFAQHLSACVATGAPFFGRAVRHGLAVYLAGEGYHGLARRLQAIESHHHLGLANSALLVSKVGASVLSRVEVASIRAAIEGAELRYGMPLRLLVVDTLSRFIAPGDESKAQDMSAYLNAIDELRGEATSLTLHHPGHTDAQRGRGSSSWRGGVDIEYALGAQGDVITVTCVKMKDGPKPDPFSFRITPASTKLWRDDGSLINSVVIVPTEVTVRPRRPTGKNQLKLLQELERLAEQQYVVWTEIELRAIAKALGMGRNRAQEAVLGLRTLGYLVNTAGGCHVPHIVPKRPKASETSKSDEACTSETSDDSLESDGSDASVAEVQP